jgi:uncharacterized metal-binding protein YceD (DUF177 family)
MKIKVHQIPEEGVHLEGEDAPAVMDVNEELFRFEKPIAYKLDVMWIGDKSILARGQISTVVRAKCVQTLEWFDLPLVVEQFSSDSQKVHGDEVDLTEQIREDILLLLPANPVSPQAKPLKAKQPNRKTTSGSVVWGKLDKLKLK